MFAGNGLEFYDFMTYAFFAVYIGRTFFPSGDPTLSLLASLGTFGVGFITRPLGALYFGPLADRIGRRPVMVASFTLMGAGITGLCLTPSYAQIGIAAPILVMFFRLVQGFALGGEVGPATAYMVEAAPPLRRGLYGSMQACTVDASNAFAGVVGLVLSLCLSQQQLQDWGWRVAMGIGVLIVPFGLWMRARLPETLPAATDAQPGSVATRAAEPFFRSVRPHLRVLTAGLIVLASLTIGGYT
ncbi:MAG: MFS transporter, partial [Steroidobacteraceae bacterium]